MAQPGIGLDDLTNGTSIITNTRVSNSDIEMSPLPKAAQGFGPRLMSRGEAGANASQRGRSLGWCLV